MAGLLSKQWHNKRVGWKFYPAHCLGDVPIFQQQGNLRTLLQMAEQSRPAMRETGELFAKEFGGTFTLAANKTYESALRKIGQIDNELPIDQREINAHDIIDPARGVIIVDDTDGIERVRKKLKSILDYRQDTVVLVGDRYSRPPSIPIRGIFMYVRLPNGVIGEIQVHTRDYWNGLQAIRQDYETHRAMMDERYINWEREREANLAKENGEPLPYLESVWNEADESRLIAAQKKRTQQLNNLAVTTGVTVLEQAAVNFENDCSYPRRPHHHEKTGQFGYLIPALRQGEDDLSKYEYKGGEYKRLLESEPPQPT